MKLSPAAIDFLRDISTGIDGTSYDMGRVVGLGAVVVYLMMGVVMVVVAVWHGDFHFDWIGFGTGLAAIAGGVGALIYAKKDTEPKPEKKDGVS